MSIRRLGAECSLQSISSGDSPGYHFTVHEFAELTAGRRITLRTLGFSSWSSDPDRRPTAESLVQSTLNTVLPDSDDCGDALIRGRSLSTLLPLTTCSQQPTSYVSCRIT